MYNNDTAHTHSHSFSFSIYPIRLTFIFAEAAKIIMQ